MILGTGRQKGLRVLQLIQDEIVSQNAEIRYVQWHNLLVGITLLP